MPYFNILFKKANGITNNDALESEAPQYLVDLNLDQIISTITNEKEEYKLKPFFYIPLNDIDAIKYRHEIMQDAENAILLKYLRLFTKKMGVIQDYIFEKEKLYHKYQKERLFFER